MKLQTVHRQLPWPPDVAVPELRTWIQDELASEGDVLRWAITAVSINHDRVRILQLEAVISA